ncbi:MAG: GNAT family N-acetyltransferase [Saccharofermentanales bacterium]
MLSLNLQGEKVVLKLVSGELINGIIDFYDRNRERISQYNPVIPAEYFSAAFWENKAKYRNSSLKREHALDLMVLLPEYPERVIGHIRIFNIEPSPRYSCEIGYTIDGLLEGRGYMHEAIRLALSFIKNGLALHRVTAICHPENARSQKLLASLDFKKEGVLHESLSMNDGWQDMDLFYCLI